MFFRSSLNLGLVLPGLLESTLKFPIYKLNFQFLMAYLREYYQVVLLLHIVFHFCLSEMVKLHALGTFTSSRCCHFEWERTTFVIPGKEKGRWENYRNSTKMYHSTVVLIYLYPTLEKVTLFPWNIKEMTDCTNTIIPKKPMALLTRNKVSEKKIQISNSEQNCEKIYYRTSPSKAQISCVLPVKNAFKKSKPNQLQH